MKTLLTVSLFFSLYTLVQLNEKDAAIAEYEKAKTKPVRVILVDSHNIRHAREGVVDEHGFVEVSMGGGGKS